VPTFNAPAKKHDDANPASSAHVTNEEGGNSPLRLLGGGKISIPLYTSEEEDQPKEKTEEAAQQAAKKRRENAQEAQTSSQFRVLRA